EATTSPSMDTSATVSTLGSTSTSRSPSTAGGTLRVVRYHQVASSIQRTLSSLSLKYGCSMTPAASSDSCTPPGTTAGYHVTWSLDSSKFTFTPRTAARIACESVPVPLKATSAT